MNIYYYAEPSADETISPATLTIDVEDGGAIILSTQRPGEGAAEPASLTLPRRQVRLLYRVFKSLALDQPILPDGPEAEED